MKEEFIIPLDGLAQGRTGYCWKAGKEFFGSFENSEILDADLEVNVTVEKSGRYVGVDCDVNGSVTVSCDRCMEDLEIPVGTGARLSVKFGDVSSQETEETEDGREIIMVPQTDTDLDMKQIVYDYVCISLPMQRVHEEGHCNPEAIKYLNAGNSGKDAGEDAGNNPFAALKGLLNE